MEYKGKKFVWKPINRATRQKEVDDPHYGKIVTVIREETCDRLRISVDDFPECNGKIRRNQFLADKDELYFI